MAIGAAATAALGPGAAFIAGASTWGLAEAAKRSPDITETEKKLFNAVSDIGGDIAAGIIAGETIGRVVENIGSAVAANSVKGTAKEVAKNTDKFVGKV